MKKYEAESIMKFVDACPGFLSNHEMIVLCEGLRIANIDANDTNSSVWWNATGHLGKIFEEENGND